MSGYGRNFRLSRAVIVAAAGLAAISIPRQAPALARNELLNTLSLAAGVVALVAGLVLLIGALRGDKGSD